MADVYLHPTVAQAGTDDAPPVAIDRRATDRFDSDEPVTECDLCIALLGAVALVLSYGLIWAFEWIRRLQMAVHSGVTP